jgi:hypothetical protein
MWGILPHVQRRSDKGLLRDGEWEGFFSKYTILPATSLDDDDNDCHFHHIVIQKDVEPGSNASRPTYIDWTICLQMGFQKTSFPLLIYKQYWVLRLQWWSSFCPYTVFKLGTQENGEQQCQQLSTLIWCYRRILDSAIRIDSKLWAGRPRNRVFIPGTCKRSLVFLMCPPTFLYNRYQDLLSQGFSNRSVKLITHSHLMLRLAMSGAIPPIKTCSWTAQRHIYLYLYNDFETATK